MADSISNSPKPMHLSVEKNINLSAGNEKSASRIDSVLSRGDKAIAMVTLTKDFMAGGVAKNVKDMSLSVDTKSAVQYALESLKEQNPDLSGEVTISVNPKVGLLADLGKKNTNSVSFYTNNSDRTLKKNNNTSATALSHVEINKLELGQAVALRATANNSKSNNVQAEPAAIKAEPVAQQFHVKDISQPLTENNLTEVQTKDLSDMPLLESVGVVTRRSLPAAEDSNVAATQTTADTAIGLSFPAGAEFFAPGRNKLERSTSLPVGSTIDHDFLVNELKRSVSSPAIQGDKQAASDISASIRNMAAEKYKTHRDSDNRLAMIMAGLGVTLAAISVLGMVDGGHIGDNEASERASADDMQGDAVSDQTMAETAYDNADQADAVATALQDNEQAIVDKEKTLAHDSAYYDSIAEQIETAMATDGNISSLLTMGTNDQGQLVPTGFNAATTGKAETAATAAATTAEQNMTQAIQTEIATAQAASQAFRAGGASLTSEASSLNTQADTLNADADKLSKEAKEASGTGGSVFALGMSMTGLGTYMYTRNKMRNHKAEPMLGAARFKDLTKGAGSEGSVIEVEA